MKKKKSIFSALEGGHLDASLFGTQVTGKKPGDKDDEQTRLPRRQRFSRRIKGLAEDRGKPRR